MKNIKLWSVLTLFAMAFAFASCSHEAVNEPAQKKMVQFEVTNVLDVNVSDMSAPRRAASGVVDPSEAEIKDIWVFDNGSLALHQTNNDEDFGYPTLELTYGEHTITFIASGQGEQSVEDDVWISAKPENTFGKSVSIDVTNNTSVETITLKRVYYSIKWQSLDVVPSHSRSLKIAIGCHSTHLNTNLLGVDTTKYEKTYTDISKFCGKTINVTASGFPYAGAATGDSIDTSITFCDASDNVIVTHSKRVPVWANKVTEISGELFGNNPQAPLQVDNTTMDVFQVEL